jgi:hypothetical protein
MTLSAKTKLPLYIRAEESTSVGTEDAHEPQLSQALSFFPIEYGFG